MTRKKKKFELSGVKFDQGRVAEEFEYWSEFKFMEPSEIQGKWD